MKQILFTFLMLFVIGMLSCRRNQVDPDIKEYDKQQILSYISANGITGMVRDTSGGDTTGIYYKIIDQGTGPALNYPDAISYVYTLKTFDNKYITADTVTDESSVMEKSG